MADSFVFLILFGHRFHIGRQPVLFLLRCNERTAARNARSYSRAGNSLYPVLASATQGDSITSSKRTWAIGRVTGAAVLFHLLRDTVLRCAPLPHICHRCIFLFHVRVEAKAELLAVVLCQ